MAASNQRTFFTQIICNAFFYPTSHSINILPVYQTVLTSLQNYSLEKHLLLYNFLELQTKQL